MVDDDGAGVSESESDIMSEETAKMLLDAMDAISGDLKVDLMKRENMMKMINDGDEYYDQLRRYHEQNDLWRSKLGVRAEGPYLRKLNRQFSCIADRYKILDVVGKKSSWKSTVLKAIH